jgi:hypothetical protein
MCCRYEAYFWWLVGLRQLYISEKTNNIEANEGVQGLKIYRLQQLYEVPWIYERFLFYIKRSHYLMEKTSQGIARGTNRIHYGPQRNFSFVDVGKTI